METKFFLSTSHSSVRLVHSLGLPFKPGYFQCSCNCFGRSAISIFRNHLYSASKSPLTITIIFDVFVAFLSRSELWMRKNRLN